MAPNLIDIILLAFLHDAFISLVLLLLVFLIFIAMLLLFSLTVFSIVAVDLYAASSTFSSYFETAKANLQLGFVLLLCTLLRHVIALVSASRPWFQRTLSTSNDKARHAMSLVDALQRLMTPQYS